MFSVIFHRSLTSSFVYLILILSFGSSSLYAQSDPSEEDFLRQLQRQAVETGQTDWIHWGDHPKRFSNWTNHSNRLIPVYTFGMSLDSVQGVHSAYRSKEKIKVLYDALPEGTFNERAQYFDQTQLYELQQTAWSKNHKKNIIVLLFDGMDWQTTQAAAIYRRQAVTYTDGRGDVLSFQTYRNSETDFGFCVTSCHNSGTQKDVDSQTVSSAGGERGGGYNSTLGGPTPWARSTSATYLMGRDKSMPHRFTDSAASATALMAGQKTYNSAIGVDHAGKQLTTIAHQMQKSGSSVGVVTNVPISHATPAAAYAHNVNRNDYQDITRDLLGLPSISHQENPLPGMDVVIGCGWGSETAKDFKKQGANFVPGNPFLTEEDMTTIDLDHEGKYVVATRTAGAQGAQVLAMAVDRAIQQNARLLGFFGADRHLPYRTADGNYDPTRGIRSAERYSQADLFENPKLAEMTDAALKVLGKNPKGFWLLVEAGDVDWANHNNNLDDAIGAVYSGESAFDSITKWVEKKSSWEETLLIVTADHGHMMTLDQPERLIKTPPQHKKTRQQNPKDSSKGGANQKKTLIPN